MNYVSVSVKVVLDSNGARPTSGEFHLDKQIQKAIDDINRTLTRISATWRVDLIEIRDVKDISHWYNLLCSQKADMELEAEASPNRFRWNDQAINIYVVNDLDPCGGVCSFPSGDPSDDIILIQNDGGIINAGIGWLHELGHYFGLEHTDDDDGNCIINGQCPDTFDCHRNIMSRRSGNNHTNAVFTQCQLDLITSSLDPLMGSRRGVLTGSGAPTSGSVYFTLGPQPNTSPHLAQLMRYDLDTRTLVPPNVHTYSTTNIQLVVDQGLSRLYWFEYASPNSAIMQGDAPDLSNQQQILQFPHKHKVTGFVVLPGRAIFYGEVIRSGNDTIVRLNNHDLGNGTTRPLWEKTLKGFKGRGFGIRTLQVDPVKQIVYFMYMFSNFTQMISVSFWGTENYIFRTSAITSSLNLDLRHAWFFWYAPAESQFNDQQHGVIFRSNLGGEDETKLVTTAKRDITHSALIVDPSGERLFYSDNLGVIRMSDLDGLRIVTLFDTLHTPYRDFGRVAHIAVSS